MSEQSGRFNIRKLKEQASKPDDEMEALVKVPKFRESYGTGQPQCVGYF